jgi:hypothetical protein
MILHNPQWKEPLVNAARAFLHVSVFKRVQTVVTLLSLCVVRTKRRTKCMSLCMHICVCACAWMCVCVCECVCVFD